jgi:hypothetical protein
MMRCGRLPPVDESTIVEDGRAFMLDGVRRAFQTIPKLGAYTCAGYASELPEVRDVVYAYPQWKERTLTEWLGGEPPSAVLLACLAAVEGGKNQCDSDRIEKHNREAEARKMAPGGITSGGITPSRLGHGG